MTVSSPPPGWYADPSGPVDPAAGGGPAGPSGLRYWDGRAWTEHRAPAPAAYPTQPYPTQPYPPQTYPAQPSSQPPAQGTDGFAIAALVLGIVAAVPLAVVFGIVALVRIGRSRRPGKGLAIAGLVIAGAWAALFAVGIAVAAGNHDFRIGTPGQIDQADLKVGDCIQVPQSIPDRPRSFTAKDCADLHNGEVFRVGDLPAGTYPGESAMADQVFRTCQQLLGPFLGGDASQSPLHVVYIYPTATSWALGQRGYVCIAVDRDKDVTGTMRHQLSGT